MRRYRRGGDESAGIGGEHIELHLVRRLDDRDVTHLRYRVRRPEEAQ
ncbi:MAG TPA: hypothetical protein VGL93_23215 [Streptosporangiaceae bacterium]|jgi:hypothetical protein